MGGIVDYNRLGLADTKTGIIDNIKTNKLRMQAIILNSDELLDKGVPEISMEIPFSEFDKILHNWIDNVNLSNFIMAAKQEKWKSTHEDHNPLSSNTKSNRKV